MSGSGIEDNRRWPRTVAFIPGTVLLPTLAAAVGLDGGPIFQIFAVENLDLTPQQLGIAFGVGVVSLPIQILAARIPLRRVRPNAQLFFVTLAIQCLILAALIAAGATGAMALIALAVTVLAEISVSVLYAPAWQPLMSVSLIGVQRQHLNSRWPAMARGLLAGALILFEGFDSSGRAAFLLACGVLAALSAASLYAIPKPDEAAQEEPDQSDKPEDQPPSLGRVKASSYRKLLVTVGAVNLGALPLWLVYLETSLWSQANLGLVGAAQTIASLAALLAWRATEGELAQRGRIAAIALALAGAAAAALGGPVDNNVEIGLVYGVTIVITVSVTVIRLVILEELHRQTPANVSVRAFTMLDVVASTSLQIGLVAAGFLILPANTLPYRVFLLTAVIAAVITTRGALSKS